MVVTLDEFLHELVNATARDTGHHCEVAVRDNDSSDDDGERLHRGKQRRADHALE